MSNRNLRLFTVVALGMIVTSGLLEGAKGLSLPHFLTDLSVSPAAGAAIFSAGAFGFSLTSFTFGTLSQHLGLKRLVWAGFTIAATALASFLTFRNPVVLYFSSAFLGTGLSLVEMSTSLPISLLYDGPRQSGMLNLLHGFYGLGTLAGSAWAGFWFAHGAGWRVAIGLVGVGVSVWAFSFVSLPALPVPRSRSAEGGGYGPLFRDPAVWAAVIALAAAVAVEIGMSLWLPTYLQRAKGVPETTSALFTTLFFLGFTGMRLAGAWAVQRFGSVRSMLTLGLVGTAGLTGLVLLPGQFGWLGALVGAGVSVAFPTCVALVSTRYPDRVGRVYSLMYSGGGVSGIMTGPLMGLVAQQAGLNATLGLLLGGQVILLTAIGYYGWATRTPATVS
ncbi:MAG TPA: MFS transporter [Symbiobacteriaceae bacterium]|jgi:fucose permease